MSFAGMTWFVRWWLNRMHRLPIPASTCAATIRTIIRLWPQNLHDNLRLDLQRTRNRIAEKLTGLIPPDEQRRLQGLETSIVHILLSDWNNL